MVYKNLFFIIFITVITNVILLVTKYHHDDIISISFALIFAHLVEMVRMFNIRSVKTNFIDMLTFVFMTSLVSFTLVRPNNALTFDTWFVIEMIIIGIVWAGVSKIIDKFFGEK